MSLLIINKRVLFSFSSFNYIMMWLLYERNGGKYFICIIKECLILQVYYRLGKGIAKIFFMRYYVHAGKNAIKSNIEKRKNMMVKTDMNGYV